MKVLHSSGTFTCSRMHCTSLQLCRKMKVGTSLLPLTANDDDDDDETVKDRTPQATSVACRSSPPLTSPEPPKARSSREN